MVPRAPNSTAVGAWGAPAGGGRGEKVCPRRSPPAPNLCPAGQRGPLRWGRMGGPRAGGSAAGGPERGGPCRICLAHGHPRARFLRGVRGHQGRPKEGAPAWKMAARRRGEEPGRSQVAAREPSSLSGRPRGRRAGLARCCLESGPRRPPGALCPRSASQGPPRPQDPPSWGARGGLVRRRGTAVCRAQVERPRARGFGSSRPAWQQVRRPRGYSGAFNSMALCFPAARGALRSALAQSLPQELPSVYDRTRRA